MRPRIFKLARRIVLFLLLGAAVNVAVAWGCALINPLTNGKSESARDFFQPDYRNWWVEVRSVFGGSYVRSEWIKGSVRGSFSHTKKKPREIVQKWCVFICPDVSDAPSFSRYVETDAMGWPMFALLSIVMRDEWLDTQSNEKSYGLFIGKHANKWGVTANRCLPVIPIWPGFMINTVFYAAVCWLLVAAPFAVRRRRRIKRGLCPACAYPVGASAVCTECGGPVKSKGRID